MEDPTVVSTITTALSGVGGELLTVAAVGLGIGATLLVLRKGWRIVGSFIR